ncbi:MAG: cation transporter [Wenzhouxiangella sp.]|nr:cation transporter [Wenzhouxiangella sp.]MCH8477221.1 cation diffusion facilitator family transporter [Wenzhouxiangella sp.]TVR95263.1 MAG: cation transporter [Wenzhouxiangellaceae bacterium]
MASDSVAKAWPLKRRVTLIGALVNLVLAVAKMIGGTLAQSQALIVDGVHSLSDLASDVLVLFAARYGSLDADLNHPYGHARVETLATLVVGVVLLAVAVGFLLGAFSRLFLGEDLVVPEQLALWVALGSILAKEAMFHATRRVAHRTGSSLMMANAWHHRSDALSSLVVMVGVGGALLGLPWFDALAAAIVALMLAWVAWKLLAGASLELIDTGLSRKELSVLAASIEGVAGVRGFQRLRTRRMAGQVLVDVQILVDGQISVAEADSVAEQVRGALIDQLPGRADITIGIRPAG